MTISLRDLNPGDWVRVSFEGRVCANGGIEFEGNDGYSSPSDLAPEYTIEIIPPKPPRAEPLKVGERVNWKEAVPGVTTAGDPPRQSYALYEGTVKHIEGVYAVIVPITKPQGYQYSGPPKVMHIQDLTRPNGIPISTGEE